MHILYQRLLRLYPADYRMEYGEEMFEVFSQACADVRTPWLRAGFFGREFTGLLAGALFERIRQLTGNHHWPLYTSRRFRMRDKTWRYSKATIVLMTLILACTVMIIQKAESVALSLPHSNPSLPPIRSLTAALSPVFALAILSTAIIAIVVWAILFALRRSGVHRLSDVQTWPQQ